jgi:hypothetical protein
LGRFPEQCCSQIFYKSDGRSLFRKITDTVIGTTRRSAENGDVDEVDGKEIE